MEVLKQLYKEYIKYIEWGYNQNEASKRALEETFKNIGSPHSNPYLNLESDNFAPSHIFYDGYVFFFDGTIYQKETNL